MTAHPRQKFCSDSCDPYHNQKPPEKPEERKIYYRVCRYCGKEFSTDHHQRFYCSNDCAYEVHKARNRHSYDLTCKYCGKTFVSNRNTTLFCSEECRENLNNESRLPPRKCKYCGKEFRPLKSQPLQTYCSKKCRDSDTLRTIPKPAPRRKKSDKSLDQWCREAKLCGLSYGIYRNYIERQGKTFEELRRQAVESRKGRVIDEE